MIQHNQASNRVMYVNGASHQIIRQKMKTLHSIILLDTISAKLKNIHVTLMDIWTKLTALNTIRPNFGETKNGVWIPKEITGLTYGTNGFRLTFADSSSLGDDTSGNGNDYTASGLASTDVVLDSPENNFCTMNKLDAI